MNYLILLAGIICAGAGGELFVRGTIGLARWLRVSAGIISVTVTAFATSSPELSVAVSSAFKQIPSLALGNALGGNILNVSLILGISLLIGKIRTDWKSVKRDYYIALFTPVLIGILGNDGTISRIDGLLMLSVFTAWIIKVTLSARSERISSVESIESRTNWISVVFVITGLGLLIIAGSLIVTGASGIAAIFGIHRFVIGAVIVAIGTSMPELATSVISRIRGYDDIGLNTVLGSNIFNGLFIIGIASIIDPIIFVKNEVMPVLLFGIIATAVILPIRNGLIERWRGFILLAIYIIFVISTL